MEPLVKGGQGRSAEQLMADAGCWFQMTTLILLACFFGVPVSYDGE